MDEGTARRRAGTRRTKGRTADRLTERPDRIALWAVFLALFAALAAAASSASAEGSGGISQEPQAPAEGSGECVRADFGDRPLSLGDCGFDVKTLNWVLSSKPFGRDVGLGPRFEGPTEEAVIGFQEQRGLDADGVVEDSTRRELKRSMDKEIATWYGPGFYGNQTACGVELEPKTIGVAHRELPCGTRVTFAYKGEWLRARVIDRGPYAFGASWDLTEKAAKKLGFEATDKLRAAPIKK